MLTADLVRPRLRGRQGELLIEFLDDPRGQRTAADLIALFKQQHQYTAAAWGKAVETYEADRVDYIVIRGLAKVLADAATFEPVELPIAPVELRRLLYAQGPVFTHTDLFHRQTREDVLEAVAAETGIPPQTIDDLLYADRTGANVMMDAGPDWTPTDLINRYNLELARAALYWSDAMSIQVYDTFKDFWRYLKLFKLMFWATPIEGGYQVEIDGPISPFVQSTTRYGRQFAAFLPALFLCEHWNMQASVRPPHLGKTLTYSLDHNSALRTHFKRSPLFDSRLEADFAAEFESRFGNERGKWLLTREDQVLLVEDTVMIPDFTLTHHDNGKQVLIEIVGFWHPDYLRRKLEKVRAAKMRNLILLIYEGVNLSPDRLRDVPGQVLYFKNKPVMKDVLAAVERTTR
jgi:predicted nuclease of restriction endonuclease-like RecB superfamily